MPRLFTALEVPRPVALSLSLFKGGLPGSRWIEAENYHVTLRFIGDVETRLADELADAFDQIDAPPLNLSIHNLSVFGSKKPHALIALVDQQPHLTELAFQMERLCQRLGLQAEPRRFVPHVTLARLKNTKPEEAALYLSQRGLIQVPDFMATRFVLMSSRDSVGGGPYGIEAVYPMVANAKPQHLETRITAI